MKCCRFPAPLLALLCAAAGLAPTFFAPAPARAQAPAPPLGFVPRPTLPAPPRYVFRPLPASVGATGQTSASGPPVPVGPGTPPPLVPPAPLSVVQPACDAAWTSAALSAAWANTYEARTDARLPFRLIGNGIYNDLAGFNADEAWVSAHGGGVIILRAGTYRLNTNGGDNINLRTGVFVCGEGEGVTIIAYNGSPQGFSGGVYLSNVVGTGLIQLTLRNDAPTPPAQPGELFEPQNCSSLGINGNVLFKRVTWTLGYGHKLQLYKVNGLDIEDSTLDGHLSDSGVYAIAGTDGVTLHRVHVRSKQQRPFTLGCRSLDLSGVQWMRDPAPVSTYILGTGVESGGPDFSYCQGLTISGCSESVTGPTDQNVGAGEALMCQDDSGNPFHPHFGDVGALSSASGTTLADASKAWPATWLGLDGCPNIPLVVGITEKGSPALGQYRTVISHTATTVTFDAPFSPAPNPGDHYFIGMWVAKDVRITGCSFSNNTNPVEIVGGGCNVEIDHNSILDSGGIALYGFSHTVHGAGRTFPLWNARVHDNYIANPNAQQVSSIAFTAAVDDTVYGGSLIANVSAWSNTLVPQPLGAAWTQRLHGSPGNGSADPSGYDGIYLNVTGGGLATAALRAQEFAGTNTLNGLNNGLAPFDAAAAARPLGP